MIGNIALSCISNLWDIGTDELIYLIITFSFVIFVFVIYFIFRRTIKMLTDAHIKDLEVKGYTVVKDVISRQECDEAIAEYRAWLSNFGEKFPKTFNSIIKDHNVGHMETTWRLRLKAKPLFSQLWKTEKLLTSFDAIAIGRPPEEGHEDFQDTRKYWLHADTTPSRIGLHAYQGALYLEEQTKNDWTFQVIEGSHKYMDEFFIKFPEKSRLSRQLGYYTKIEADDTEYFMSNKCRLSRVPVPKGGMVLWDSRLVHANARPLPVKHVYNSQFCLIKCITNYNKNIIK